MCTLTVRVLSVRQAHIIYDAYMRYQRACGVYVMCVRIYIREPLICVRVRVLYVIIREHFSGDVRPV